MMIRKAALAAFVLGASLAVIPAAHLGAQASLSTQGFGFPTGQFSARANGTAGAIAEIDPLSPVNPASIALIGSRLIYFQLEPEFRTVTTANGSERTTTSRYPVVFGALPIGRGWVLSLGSSTLLDRTATTTFNTTQFLNGTDSVPMSTKFKVDGAMNDVRLALAWSPASWLKLGVGAHALAGHNLVSVTQSFADSTTFATFTQQRILGFSGGAASAGIELSSKLFSAAISGRAGGNVNLHSEDTLLATGKVPAHYGASLAFTGIPNSAIAIRTAHDNWSSLNSLGSADLKGVDAWDTSVGADIAGPKFSDRTIFLRAGFRDRTLPFQADLHDVKEQSFTGGLGTMFANGRVVGDLAVIRANRTADGLDASEHAWTVSIGLTLRP
jgi:hypothetical protein